MGRRPAGSHQVFVVGQPRGVGEQVTDGDGAAVGGKDWKDLGESGVIAQFVIVHKQHDGHGGELLGKRGEAEVRTAIDGGLRTKIAHAVAVLENRAAVLAYEDGTAGRMWAGERSINRIEVGSYGPSEEYQSQDQELGHFLNHYPPAKV